MLTRRQFARGLALTVAGLLVPAPLAAAAEEPARRLWALDGSMLGAGPRLVIARDMSEAAQFAEAAGRVLLTIEDGVRAFEAWGQFRAPDPAAITHFVARVEWWRDQAPAIKAAYRRERLLTARTRPAYRRRAA